MTVGTFYDAMEQIAPFSTAEKWDNVGLLIGGRELPARRTLLALDLTGPVLQEAEELGADLVVTHHPLLLEPAKSLSSDSIAYRAVRQGISVISAHTNLDLAEGGVNDALAKRLGLLHIRPFVQEQEILWKKIIVFAPKESAVQIYRAMAAAGAGEDGNYSHCAFLGEGEGRFLPLKGASPTVGQVGVPEQVEETRLEMLCPPGKLGAVIWAMKASHPYEHPAYDVYDNQGRADRFALGRIGELGEAVPAEMFARRVKERLHAGGVRFTDGQGPISTVAVCGGSGAGLLAQADRMGVQALVTGEAKHHQLLEAAERGIALIDAGHFATENVVMEPLKKRLAGLLPEAELHVSAACTDGLHYLA